MWGAIASSCWLIDWLIDRVQFSNTLWSTTTGTKQSNSLPTQRVRQQKSEIVCLVCGKFLIWFMQARLNRTRGSVLYHRCFCKKTSKPGRHTVEMYVSAIIVFGLVMTLTSDLWPWETFQQCPLTWWVYLPSFIAIRPLSTEISRQA